MSSYYELMWRDDELTSYTTDKLNFIYNAIDHPLSVRYRQLYPNRLDWQKAVNRHNAAIQKSKTFLLKEKIVIIYVKLGLNWIPMHELKQTMVLLLNN